MTREEILKEIKPLSWGIKLNDKKSSIITRRAGTVYVIGKGSKKGFRLSIIDYINRDLIFECVSQEEAIQRANDIMMDKIIQYFNIEEEI